MRGRAIGGRFDASGRKVLDNVTGLSLAAASSGGSGGDSVGQMETIVGATPAAIRAQAPSGGFPDGQPVTLRLGTYPDLREVRGRYLKTQDVFIGDVFNCFRQIDQNYMGTNTTALAIIATDDLGNSNTAIGTFPRGIQNVYDLYNLGGWLQTCYTCFAHGTGGGAVYTGRVLFFPLAQADNYNTVTLTPANAAGWSPPLASGASAVPQMPLNIGWQDLNKYNTSTKMAVADLGGATKNVLQPRLYGISGALSYGGIIDVSVDARWVF